MHSYLEACYLLLDLVRTEIVNIGIMHISSCINICWVLRKLFKHEAVRPSVQTSTEGPGKCKCMKQTCDPYYGISIKLSNVIMRASYSRTKTLT